MHNKNNKSGSLRKVFFATAASLALMSASPSWAADNETPENLLSDLDPIVQMETLDDAKGDDDLIDDKKISVSQFHALEAAYTDDRITVEILTKMGLKTSGQHNNTSEYLNDNVDYVVQARKDLKDNPLLRSNLHLRQMVRDASVVMIEANLKIPKHMVTGELTFAEHKSELSSRYKADGNFHNIDLATYALGNKAMIDQTVTLNDLLAAGYTNYDNDSDSFTYNAGFIIEMRDKSFAENPDLDNAARTAEVTALVKHEVARHDDIDLTQFEDVVISFKPEYRQKYEDLAYARLEAENDVYFGDLCYDDFFLIDRLMYDQSLDARTVAEQCGKIKYMNLDAAEADGKARFIDEALGLIAEARDALLEKTGGPDMNSEKSIRAFQKQVIAGTRTLIEKYYHGRLEEFTDIQTQDITDFEKYKFLLKNRIEADDYVQSADPEEYVWLERALTDPSISKQTLLDSGLSEGGTGTSDLSKNVDVVIDVRSEILSQEGNAGMKGAELREAVREKAYAITAAQEAKSSAEFKQDLKTIFAPVAGGLLALFGLGAAGVRYRNYRRSQPRVKNN